MIAAAFDVLAARYDEIWTEMPAGRAQRELVWREVDPLFQPGMRVLDLGCGTGADAEHYAAREVTVDAVDASAAMVERATARGRFTARVLPVEAVGTLSETYDAVLSNFGVLNCVETGHAEGLRHVVRPGGILAVCILGRFCAWEMFHYCLRGQFRKAFRRVPGTAASSLGITVHYPTARELAKTFAPHFELQRWMGIGLAVPPSYVKLPDWMVRVFAAFDGVLARIPLLRGAADHRLLIFVRK